MSNSEQCDHCLLKKCCFSDEGKQLPDTLDSCDSVTTELLYIKVAMLNPRIIYFFKIIMMMLLVIIMIITTNSKFTVSIIIPRYFYHCRVLSTLCVNFPPVAFKTLMQLSSVPLIKHCTYYTQHWASWDVQVGFIWRLERTRFLFLPTNGGRTSFQLVFLYVYER